MTAKQLTDSILQLAIQGKLVPQDPNDEPASVLLERIREEKRRLVKGKKIKADKNESHIYLSDDGHWMEHFVNKKIEDICIDDEIPFNVPCGWGWCRIDEYACKVTDFVASGSFASLRENVKYYSNKEYAILVRTKDFQTNFETDLVYTDKHGYEFLSNSNLYGGELILPNIGASIGKVFIVPTLSYRMTLAPNTVMVRFYWDEQRDWLYTLFCSRYGKNLLNDISSSTAQGKFNKTDFKRLLIPLPPLAEQHRIVERIEEILPIVNEYGEAYEEASKMDAELPNKLKKSILQEAVKGKLGTQNSNDEPACVLLEQIREEKNRLIKEGVLKKKDIERIIIDEENYPYTLPEKWEWVRLQDVTTYISRGKSPVYSETKKYPVVAQKCNQWSGFSLEKAKFIDPKTVDKYAEERILQDGDLLWNSTGIGTLGRMAIYDSSVNEYGWAVADSHVTVIRTRPDFAYYKYLYYYFASPEVQTVIEDRSDGSTKQKELAQNTVKMYEVPLPPLAEQHRIVQRIEELYAEIDNMTINKNNNETDKEKTEV